MALSVTVVLPKRERKELTVMKKEIIFGNAKHPDIRFSLSHLESLCIDYIWHLFITVFGMMYHISPPLMLPVFVTSYFTLNRLFIVPSLRCTVRNTYRRKDLVRAYMKYT